MFAGNIIIGARKLIVSARDVSGTMARWQHGMCGESVCCFTSGPALLSSTSCCNKCILHSRTRFCRTTKNLEYILLHYNLHSRTIFLKGCNDLDDFVCKAFIIVIHSEPLNNQCESKHQWLWPVWSQLEVFKSPTVHFLVPVSGCKNQRHPWRHKIFNGHNFKN